MAKKRSYQEALGASHPAGTQQITLFVPAKDKDGDDIDQACWVDEALTCFGTLFRGATAFPPGKGVWRNDDNDGELIFEPTVMIVTYADPAAFDENVGAFRQFLHKMGREANQGEVGVIISGTYHGISNYDND